MKKLKVTIKKLAELKETTPRLLSKPFLRLDEFLEDNKHLFTIIGVFGALSIYLKTAVDKLDYTQKMGDFVIVIGFTIVIILSLVMLFKIAKASSESEGSFISWENTGLFAFGFFFIFLMISLVSISSSFSGIWAVIYMFGILFFSAIVPMFYLSMVGEVSDVFENRLSINPIITTTIVTLATSALGTWTFHNTSMFATNMYSKLPDGVGIMTWFKAYYTLPGLIVITISYVVLAVIIISFLAAVGYVFLNKLVETVIGVITTGE